MSNGLKLLGAGAAGAAVVALFNTFATPQDNDEKQNDLSCRLAITQGIEKEKVPYIADIDLEQIIPVIKAADYQELRLINLRRDSFSDLSEDDAKAIYEVAVERFKTEISSRTNDTINLYMQSAGTLINLIGDTVGSVDEDKAAEDIKDILALIEQSSEYYSNYRPEEFALIYYAMHFEGIAEEYAEAIKELANENPAYMPSAASLFAQYDATKDDAIDLINSYLNSDNSYDQQMAIKTMGHLEYKNPGTFSDFGTTMAKFARSSDTYVANEAKRMAYYVNQKAEDSQPSVSMVCE